MLWNAGQVAETWICQALLKGIWVTEGEKTLMIWTCGTLQWCNQDSLWHTGWWKAWAWEAQNDMEAVDREGLQRVEALGYQPSWQTYLEIWCQICHVCSKPAIWKGAHWCGCCPCTCMLIKIRLWWWYDGIWVTGRTRNLFQIKQRVVTPKVRMPELSILYVTCQLVLIYISTKYHQNNKGLFKLQRGQDVLGRCRRQRNPS